MLKYFLLLLILVLSPSLDITVTKAQDDQPGFISIDCGLETPSYFDAQFNLTFKSDAGYVDTGVSQRISSDAIYSNFLEELQTLRFFPNGSRNCYTFKPAQGKGSKYLIRAWFLYGNYDGLNQPPKFDLHIGNQYWDTIAIFNATTSRRREIIHTPSSDHIHVCLIKTGPGIPFISSLELRPLDNTMYPIKNQNASLNLVNRVNINPTPQDLVVRFKDDIYDRIWTPFPLTRSRTLSTTFPVETTNGFNPPSLVMSTAAEAINASGNLSFHFDAVVTSKYFIFIHFAELEILEIGQTRAIDIYRNTKLVRDNLSPSYLTLTTIYDETPITGESTYEIEVTSTPGTTLPPILNAAEAYSMLEFSLQETFDGDVVAMVDIKTAYNITENWQGDPCGPLGFQWKGVNCSKNDGVNKPRIISLNLSFKRLVGSIAPVIFELKALTTLDLSNNLLTGGIPDFLAELDSLTVLNLKGNNFSGTCPQQLLNKANTGKLNFISDNLCGGGGGVEDKKKKSSSKVVIIAAAAAGGVFFLAICASLLAFFIMKKGKQRATMTNVETETDKRLGIGHAPNNVQHMMTPMSGKSIATSETMSISQNGTPNFVVKNKSRQFTYAEVVEITNNFQAIIGKGGFGTVYHGYVGEAQVAVKMLSPSSSQGYKEFQSEASLLMTIHHKNLTSFVGYCYEGTNMAIIYEYMHNGNMEKHLLGKGPYVLTWEERLRMAIDAGQGLEYLHHGCTPPIVHRDIKLPNILVDEKFRAKLADFGLSRAFSIEDATHVSTVVAGTPGYLDPEYYSTTRLTEKSDIYSFGIVLLEVVTGRPALQRNSDMPHIITWVSSELEKGDLDKVVDPKLRRDYAINSIWKVLEVAMSCVARNSVNRPTMNFVVMELNACLEIEKSRNETESKDSIGLISLNTGTGFNPHAR